ncbi:hypothetical protein A0H81_05576 [Grifola frondosa]|uniref:Uncharacterized protein n=1 Tax=Grifola frondosa TaxID=5627 RepID=A0A1C7MCZ9_GRIFR|nr:hypothetical protein A0H81_05576 [Grifola frondosa]
MHSPFHSHELTPLGQVHLHPYSNTVGSTPAVPDFQDPAQSSIPRADAELAYRTIVFGLPTAAVHGRVAARSDDLLPCIAARGHQPRPHDTRRSPSIMSPRFAALAATEGCSICTPPGFSGDFPARYALLSIWTVHTERAVLPVDVVSIDSELSKGHPSITGLLLRTSSPERVLHLRELIQTRAATRTALHRSASSCHLEISDPSTPPLAGSQDLQRPPSPAALRATTPAAARFG